MISKEQKEKLRQIGMYKISYVEKDGIPLIRKKVPEVENGKTTNSTIYEEFVVPSPYQIAESIFQQILDCGFSKIERVSPAKANCIVRAYQKLHYEYEFDQIFNMYGAECFVKDNVGWISEVNDSTFHLDYSHCKIGQWLYQDEKVIFDTDFVDFYIKVS